MPPSAFEDLVLDVLHAMGYGDGTEHSRLRVRAGAAMPGSTASSERTGSASTSCTCRRSDGRRRSDAQSCRASSARFRERERRRGSSSRRRASLPTRGAYAAGVSPRVILVDGERLAELMIDHNVGVSDRETYAVKRVDSDYFGDED